MPYKPSTRLPGEKANKLGHLDIIKNPIIRELMRNFVLPPKKEKSKKHISWTPSVILSDPLPIIFAVDGSMQLVTSQQDRKKKVAFVTAVLVKYDLPLLERINKGTIHPFELRDISNGLVIKISTILPIKNVCLRNMSTYDSVRFLVYTTLKHDNMGGRTLETLKWLVYEKWQSEQKPSFTFTCPTCHLKGVTTEMTLPYDASEGICTACSGIIYITDIFGFHRDMEEVMAPEELVPIFMNIIETILLYTAIREIWEENVATLSQCLFIKDGPLSFRSHYWKLTTMMRKLLQYAKDNGHMIYTFGQEKTGTFVDHMLEISESAKDNSTFVPSDFYIRKFIQGRTNSTYSYGYYTNYGAKIFVNIDQYHRLVLNIPTGNYVEEIELKDLIGCEKILATLPRILGSRYENSLVPIELANENASLSAYPSNRILQEFIEEMMREVHGS